MKIRGTFLLILVLLIVPLASAELLFSQPKNIYSIGDNFENDLQVSSTTSSVDFLIVDLVCANGELNLYKNTLSLGAGETKDVSVDARFDKKIIGSLVGTCYLKANYNGQDEDSQRFEISSSVVVDVGLTGTIYNPGEKIIIKGSSQKPNGQLVNGFVEVTVNGIDASVKTNVVNGEFNVTFILPDKAAAGNYTLETRVFELDNEGNVANEGTGSHSFNVRSVLDQAEIEIKQNSISPGDNFEFLFKAYDQTGNKFDSDVSYTVFDPNDNPIVKKVSSVDKDQIIEFSHNSTPGYWRIEANFLNVTVKKLFYIEEYMHASFDLANNTLLITNDGNVIYTKSIQISIGNHTDIKQIYLGVGEKKKYKLSAPDNNYAVSVGDGNATYASKDLLLTGRAIDVGELGNSPFSVKTLGFLLLILLSLVFVTNLVVKKRRAGSSVVKTENPLRKAVVSEMKQEASARESATILAIRTGGQSNLFGGFINKAKGKAHVYNDGQHYIMLFAPKLTKQANNEILAVQAAKEISAMVQEHASKTRSSIEAGFGLAKGDIILDTNKDVKFTAVGTVVPQSKRLANASKGDIFMSETIYKSLIGAVKSEKVDDNTWKVLDIRNREDHKGFIDGFIKRQKRI